MEILRMFNIKCMLEQNLGFEIENNSRKRKHVYAKAVFYKACRILTESSLKSIGSQLNKDHTTVLHGIKTFDETITFYEPFYVEVFKKIIRKFGEENNLVVKDVNLLTFGVR